MLRNLTPIAAVLAMQAAWPLAIADEAAAQRPFNPRPTQPYECSSMDRGWSGYFSGQKEVEYGFIRRQTAREHACFVDERNCRNWLYNMQSEYNYMVWRAECRPGLG
jgi:hypothetical protein